MEERILLLILTTLAKSVNLVENVSESPSRSSDDSGLFVTRPDRNITVEIETIQNLTLSCDIDGNPIPTSYEWQKNGRKISTNGSNSESSLRLHNSTCAQNAEYKCTACNRLGCKESTKNLRVIHKMKENAMLNSSVMENSVASFHCSLLVKPQIEREYRLVKGKFSEQMQYLDLSEFKSLLIKNGKDLVIDRVTCDDAGWYTCVATKYYKDNIYEIIGLKSAFLDVHPCAVFSWSSTSTLIILGVSMTTILVVAVLVIKRRRSAKTNNYSHRWIKQVTVTKSEENRSTAEFQMPIVQIIRSVIAEKSEYYSDSVVEYQYPTDCDWEIERNRIIIGKLLGEGAFGRVVQAEACGFLENVPVAVKMLKDNHSDEDVINLVCELEVMKIVGKHPNIITLLGCCTKDGPLYVITELAPHGNLKDFLENIATDPKKAVNNHQLVSFASQIASGMVHLSLLKYVHRDLAARNVLVGEGLVMKIADFGLARDVQQKEYYRKLTGGKMPICWMAPESLEFLVFNTKTDVWSFGVLLWEIMTLGRHPYQFHPAANLLEYLKQGNRLEQPMSCPDNVYLIMKHCWLQDPAERPSFPEIVLQLEIGLNSNVYN